MKRLLVLALVMPVWAFAQMVEVEDNSTPATGKQKASEYFSARKNSNSGNSETVSGGEPRYLALHIGTFLDGEGYKWGKGDQSDIGKLNLGVTYRIGEWVNSMDLLFRTEFTSYSLDEGSARKISFLAMLMFPDANSKFPLFFGAGLGPGFFMKQIPGESSMTIDYQLVAGARFFEVLDSVGFNFEFGLKNQLHLLKDGQFNGLFIGAGTVFAF